MATAITSPSRIAPSSQTMDSSSVPDSSVSVSSSLDDSGRFNRSISFSRNSDLQPSDVLKSEEYRQLFRLPPEEVLLQDFNCALQENILLQGHMYLFDHYICFYSNIFGFETKKIIPFQDITAVRRAKTAGIFPNAIEIVAGGKRHFFASFLSRDEAFKIIYDGWSQHGDGLKEALERQDSKSETSSQNGGVSIQNANSCSSSLSDLDSERKMEAPHLDDTQRSLNYEDDNARATASEIPDIVEEKRVAFVDAEPSTSSGSVKWNQESPDAPEIPNCYVKVAETKFPIPAEQFFNLFFSDDAVGFLESFHKKCGDKDLRCTSWSPHDKLGYTREKTFQHPIKIYFGAKCGGCKETQQFRVYKNSHLVIKTSQEVSDVPYADYFCVEGLWDVQEDGDHSDKHCTLHVYVNVAFSKRTVWKGKIEQSTMEECREAYATWIDLAHELLKQKNFEKPEGATSVVQKSQVDQENSGQRGERSERLHGNAEPGRSNDIANTWVPREQMGNPLQGYLFDATAITSTLKAAAVKSCSFLKRQGNLQLYMVIAFSVILLLMQFSIVVLLSRPQQVHVIPQADHVTTVGVASGQRITEAMHWIEKRMHLLKDEMVVVETQLERMRHEHIYLKAQLKDLECLYKQQS